MLIPEILPMAPYPQNVSRVAYFLFHKVLVERARFNVSMRVDYLPSTQVNQFLDLLATHSHVFVFLQRYDQAYIERSE